MSNILQKYQAKLDAKQDLSVDETIEVFNALLSATDQEIIAAFLDSWANKGYTSNELATCANILRENCVKVETKHDKFIDIVGTGGSKAKIFNVSTAVAFVVAGAGIPVAKHGNRAASSNTGSADALSSLGVNIVAETELAQKCLDEIGICFMFAPKFHNLTKQLAMARKSLGKPTIFNLLGPMANPANAPFQLIGIWNKDFMKPLTEAIAKLGTKKTWIVHGEDGLDEITLNGKTFVAEIIGDEVNYFEISPEDFGFERNTLNDFSDVSPEMSSEIIQDILSGKTSNNSAKDIVLINAAAAIFVGGFADDFKQARDIARESIENEKALKKLNELIEETNN
ncbi:MAG: anthranilate phosphoribosyltransferase [Acidobacteriota bacterium]|nr:anthranilate phosphoribosyltransferase [Acidobacteriota bacterium]